MRDVLSEGPAVTTPAPPAEDLPVVVIGAGPVGLAAAAHLRSYGLTPLVLEAGDAVGAAMREWGHVRTFDLADLDALGAATGQPYTVEEHHGGWLVVDRTD